MKTPMQKLTKTVKQFLEDNQSPFISPTVLHAVLEQAQKLILEEEKLLKDTFKMGATVKVKTNAAKASEKFYINNFVYPPVGNANQKQAKI
jgi:hypothetical protein